MRLALVRLFALAVLPAAALGGCRSGSALHSRYNNFRAYYNTYYNASRSLEEGERALERSSATIDRSQLVPVFPVTENVGGQSGPFQDAIDKSAELLRHRAGSKWADDALLVIGKAYFYQLNLAGAEQKFRETMAAAGVTGDRRLGDEARFWLGRTYAAGDRYDEGVEVLEEGLADDAADRRWASRMRLALGELYARAGRWDEAAETLRAGAPDEGDADVAARAYVLLGQVEEHAERWDQAADAYALALDRQPAYELAFAARVGRALVLGVDAGRTDEGLAIVRRMRADDKNYQRRGELALVEARVQAASGEAGPALALYRDVLYNEELGTAGFVKGQAHYRLGQFYRDALGDYVRASAHFDTAATALRAPSADRRASREAILDVSDEARTYAVLAGAARRIAATDSLLALGSLDDDAFRSRISTIELERRRVYVEEQRRLEAARTAQQFQGSGTDTYIDGATGGDPTTTTTAKSSSASAKTSEGAALGSAGGFLSYRNPASLQAGLIAFEQRWGSRPLVPNWRRRAAVQAGDVASSRSVVGNRVQGGLGLGEGPPPLDLSKVPRTPAKRAEMVTELAGLRYELANAFFLSLGQADTAAALYRQILTDTPDAPIAVRARYALAEIERDRGRDEAARPLYEAVAESDTTALGRASRIRLGIESAEDAAADPELETSAAYDAARARWRSGDPLGAARDLIALADVAPAQPIAPRAYLAAAAAYIASRQADSLSLDAPMPDSLVSRELLAVLQSGGDLTLKPSAPQPESVPDRQSDVPIDSRRIDDEAIRDEEVGAVRRPASRSGSGRLAPPAGEDGRAELDPRPLGRDASPRSAERSPVPPPAPRSRPEPASAEPAAPVPGKPVPVRGKPVQDNPVPAAGNPVAPAAASAAFPTSESPAPPAPRSAPASRAPLAPPDSASFTLRHHLTALVVRYPGTPYAARARILEAEIPAPLAVPDSTGTGPEDVSPLALPPADSLVAVAPRALSGLKGAEPLDPSDGGYTWRVQRVTLAEQGATPVATLRADGFRAAVLADRQSGDIIVAIGQFETLAAAQAARDRLPEWAQARPAIVELATFEVVGEGSQDAPDLDESGDDGQ